MKRTREQAYFNSYDFDAIEVLPYDEDDDEAVPHSRGSSGRYSVANGSNSSNSNAAAITKFAYLQRFGAFFGHKSATDGATVLTTAEGHEKVGASAAAAAAAAAGVVADAVVAVGQSNDNFLLPRAILKYQYQSVGGHVATSMPLTASLSNGLECQTGTSMVRANEIKPAAVASVVSATTARNKKRSIASNASSTHTTDSGLGNINISTNTATATAIAATSTAAIAAAAAAAATSTRAGSGSHYSTDKSGSSGYYSSHVCSTYSLDEHIYCEPVIDILEKVSDKEKSNKILAKQRPQLQLPTKVTGNGGATNHSISQHLDMQDAATDAVQALATADSTIVNGATATKNNSQEQKLPHYSDKLRILETSIENLDRHLKTFPCLYTQQHIVSFMQQDNNTKMTQDRSMPTATSHLDIGEKLRAYNQLPTIIEGFDTQRQQQQQQQQQMEQIDDSLLDIDLDAFLLQPKQQQQQQHQRLQQQQQQQRQQMFAGIDNPSFLSDEQLEENNYKCAKYINSCPEDAYRVDNESSPNVASNSSYAKRYEDQLHFQNTRELLEDVRDKIRLLQPTPTTDIPQELEGMIQTLKDELESYLQRMNQHSELELRQLCSGLGRQQHVVRLQNAFERRRSYAGDVQLNAYESVRDGVLISANGQPLSVREQIMTIRCASDPNFKMKRKSITEVFPVAECYIESAEPSCSVTPTLTLTTTPTPTPTPTSSLELKTTTTMVTQMQRNLNFHRPVLGPENSGSRLSNGAVDDKVDSIAEWHRKKPSIWEMYYGTNRLHQSLLGKQRHGSELVISSAQPTLSYPSSRPESDFTLDLPRAEQLRLKMEKEKKFRQRCRFITTFLSLVFFLLTVMVVSLVLTRGKRMFGSMI